MISRFMNAKDIETIKALFKKVQFVILDTIMLREYLFFNLTSKTKEETIGEMISKIKQYFPLPSDFYEQVMDCEAKQVPNSKEKLPLLIRCQRLIFPDLSRSPDMKINSLEKKTRTAHFPNMQFPSHQSNDLS